jgi:hypothetical protein
MQLMRDNRLGGLALVIGAAAGVIVMAVHPVGRQGLMSQQQTATMAVSTRMVHGFAIASLPILFLGALALTQHLNSPSRIALIALVFYGFALVALMIAGSMNGFVAPAIMSKLVAGDATADFRRLFQEYTWTLNQSLAGVFVVGACIAIFLWSLEILRGLSLSRALAIYGVLLAVGISVAYLSGRLPLTAHGFGIVTFAQSIWLAIAGASLLGQGETLKH